MALITQQQIYDVYLLQSRNVRKLAQVKKNLIRDINECVKRNRFFEIEVKTKLLSLLYSAWSEAQFVQILHTPNVFPPSIIKDIEKERSKQGIVHGWHFMLISAIKRVGSIETSSDLSVRLTKLLSIVDDHIKKQSTIRNKIAHGQWVHALNSDHTQECTEYSSQLGDLDYVQIDRLFHIHKYLGLIVRDLVQSPSKGFHNHYWVNLVELENFLENSENWNIESRKEILNKRPTYSLPRNHCSCNLD